MNPLFVDTSAWAAIADASDDQHQAAVAYQVKIAGRYRLVITNYILDELYTLLLMNVGYAQTINFKHRLDQLIEGGFMKLPGFQIRSLIRHGRYLSNSTSINSGHSQIVCPTLSCKARASQRFSASIATFLKWASSVTHNIQMRGMQERRED
ncbi:MAG: hypothetical protein ACAF41_30435 [Leptolyngbya sp. BL-A-14]